MKLLYYTSGTTGSGRIVRGIAVHNALTRNEINSEFTIVSSTDFGRLLDSLKVNHVELPPENEDILLSDNCRESVLYRTLSELTPDVILFDLLWYPIYKFIEDFNCKKILLCRQVSDRFFSIPLPRGQLDFNPDQFDLIFAIEPFKSPIDMQYLNPMIMRNRNEVYSRQEAVKKLGLPAGKRNCLIACNGEPGEFEELKKQYSYLKDAGYNLVYSSNYSEKGIFPVVDYFNAFDYIVTGAGYNSFWETVYFNKEGICVPFPRRFESQSWRVENCLNYTFDKNGADQLVDIIMGI